MSEQNPNPSDSSQPSNDPQGSFREQAEHIVAADRILVAVAKRNPGDPSIAARQLSKQQKKVLRNADPRLVSEPAFLHLAIAHRQEALALRRKGHVEWHQLLEDAEDAVDWAAQRQLQALLASILATSPEEVLKWETEFCSEHQKLAEAESKLADLRDKVQTLINAVPEQVREHTARLREQIEQSADCQALAEVSMELVKVALLIGRYGEHRSAGDEADSSDWLSFLKAEVPPAVIDDFVDGLTIDEEVVDAYFNYLLTKGVGETFERFFALQDVVRQRIYQSETVLRQWVETGEVDLDDLEDLLASAA